MQIIQHLCILEESICCMSSVKSQWVLVVLFLIWISFTQLSKNWPERLTSWRLTFATEVQCLLYLEPCSAATLPRNSWNRNLWKKNCNRGNPKEHGNWKLVRYTFVNSEFIFAKKYSCHAVHCLYHSIMACLKVCILRQIQYKPTQLIKSKHSSLRSNSKNTKSKSKPERFNYEKIGVTTSNVHAQNSLQYYHYCREYTSASRPVSMRTQACIWRIGGACRHDMAWLCLSELNVCCDWGRPGSASTELAEKERSCLSDSCSTGASYTLLCFDPLNE